MIMRYTNAFVRRRPNAVILYVCEHMGLKQVNKHAAGTQYNILSI